MEQEVNNVIGKNNHIMFSYSWKQQNQVKHIYDILDNHYYKPKLYCFWTGTNNMTENRIRNLIT